jgi:hypothetical protein
VVSFISNSCNNFDAVMLKSVFLDSIVTSALLKVYFQATKATTNARIKKARINQSFFDMVAGINL